MKDWQNFKKELLKDPEIKRGYDALELEYSIIAQVIQSRIEKGFTQKQLAQRIGTTQSAIARLEGGNTNPSIAFLQKVAQALSTKLSISLSKIV